jgi:hypothetical protein
MICTKSELINKAVSFFLSNDLEVKFYGLKNPSFEGFVIIFSKYVPGPGINPPFFRISSAIVFLGDFENFPL